AVCPTHPYFRPHRFAGDQGGPPFPDETFDVARMNGIFPLPAESLLQRETGVFLPALIDKVDGAVRPSAPHQSRNGIDYETKPIFAFLQVCVEVSQFPGGIVEYPA